MLVAGSMISGRIGPDLAMTDGTRVCHNGKPKKDKVSVRVARQHGGQLGKRNNCRVAANLSIANDHVSRPVAHQPYLPHEWGDDRYCRASVQNDGTFQRKQPIMLDQLCEVSSVKVEAQVVLVQRLHHGSRRSLRRRHTVIRQPVAALQGSAGTKELERTGTLGLHQASRRQTQAGVSQANGTGAPRKGLFPPLFATMRLDFVR